MFGACQRFYNIQTPHYMYIAVELYYVYMLYIKNNTLS